MDTDFLDDLDMGITTFFAACLDDVSSTHQEKFQKILEEEGRAGEEFRFGTTWKFHAISDEDRDVIQPIADHYGGSKVNDLCTELAKKFDLPKRAVVFCLVESDYARNLR